MPNCAPGSNGTFAGLQAGGQTGLPAKLPSRLAQPELRLDRRADDVGPQVLGKSPAARNLRIRVADVGRALLAIGADVVFELADLFARERKSLGQRRPFRHRSVEKKLAKEGHMGAVRAAE